MGDGVGGVKDAGDDRVADTEGDSGVEDAGVGGVEDAGDGVVKWRTRAAGSVEDEGRCTAPLCHCGDVKGMVDVEDTGKGAHRRKPQLQDIT